MNLNIAALSDPSCVLVDRNELKRIVTQLELVTKSVIVDQRGVNIIRNEVIPFLKKYTGE